MASEQIRNFASVSPALATAGQPTERQLHELAQQGFEVVINLGLLDRRYCLADEAGLVRSLGMTYHHVPVDFLAPTLEDLQRFFEVMAASHDKRVFVHCAANKRASTFVALYGQARLGWSQERANTFIHGVWAPDPVWTELIERFRRGHGDGTWPRGAASA